MKAKYMRRLSARGEIMQKRLHGPARYLEPARVKMALKKQADDLKKARQAEEVKRLLFG